ncbi:cobaltochelatase subunit CobN [Simplicispira psychrophila]|uniref:cobaltochelatase subunit CobN n=1 Tax=Simplicispira psychrophila TaxID=80882 RepID=UPI000A41D9EC|nr:cobaltochelatase subunit CobN [Simplicispira psychrophila]
MTHKNSQNTLAWLRRWLALCLLALAPWGAVQAAQVLFIATSNLPAGKFRQLADIARPHGIQLQMRYLERLPADTDEGLFKGFDAVFIDSYLQDVVQDRLARALPGLRAPHAWLYAAKPVWGGGLPEPVARRLITYYSNGGKQNFDGFFATLAAQLQGRSAPVGLPEPVVFPKTAVYHPRAPGLVMADPVAWLRSQGVDMANPQRRPVVALALHQQYIASMQTDFIDDLIARIEAGGAVALPFYSPMLEAGTLEQMLKPAGTRLADVLINTQIMLGAEERRAEFDRLGIPVLQAMPYRRGDEAAWAANPQGVALMDVPFYLAQAEYAGVIDIQVAAATRASDEQMVSIAAQADAVVGKALNLAQLQRKQNADKRLSIFFWNYPPGEKNLSASFLNVPRSLQTTLAALHAAGYDTESPAEPLLIGNLQRLLAPSYRQGELEPLLRDGLAAALPVAQYRQWLATLPAATQASLRARWGEPEASSMVLRRGGEAVFVVPRLMLGKVAILPQPPRGEQWDDKEKALYHSPSALPSHYYLAAYLWAREQQKSDALVHFGTHGSQEWLPGKERGLSVFDPGMLALGNVPVAYPYIADNIGEAQQAKRRGRAVIVSHQTPPFKPAGLHEVLTTMHDLLHAWVAQDEGVVKEKIKADLLAAVAKERIDRDMGWTAQRTRSEFPAFVDLLHNHLHELAETAQPLGLHTLGRAPEEQHRLATVLLMLGRPFWEAAATNAGARAADLDEALVGDYSQLAQTTPYQLLERHVVQKESTDALPTLLKTSIDQARGWYADIGADRELPALLQVLAGRHLATSYGGDPIKNPDAYPTGRNLYGFDPSRVPTPQAWAAGKDAAEQLIAEHQRLTGKAPTKLAVSLWSVETMRHQGLLEAQALWLLGVEPVWDEGGRVTGVKLVPRAALGRERVDVVLSATGLYRDHFPNAMKQLARAVQLAAEAQGLGEEANPVAAHTRSLAAQLRAQGMGDKAALSAAQTRIFSSETGNYGTGLDNATLATDSWQGKKEGDRKLAQLYLSRMQYAYGPDEATWGSLPTAGKEGESGKGGKALNLYAEQLRGTEGAVLSRSSNLYGMLTTDDPFQYLGGIALAVRYLDGKAPQLYISNLRGSGSGRVEGAAQFLSKELATRQFHPGYIKGLMAEGYAGTLQVLDATNNFWGWTAVAREIVRDDQWQEMADVYVGDKHQLGLKRWFEANNPHALAQTMERMLEAARQGYWKADPKMVAELKQRWRDLSERFDVQSDNARFQAYVGQTPATNSATAAVAPGFGLDAPLAAAEASPASAPPQATEPPAGQEPPAAEPPVVSGILMAPVPPATPVDVSPTQAALLGLLLAGTSAAGAVQQARRRKSVRRAPIHSLFGVFK